MSVTLMRSCWGVLLALGVIGAYASAATKETAESPKCGIFHIDVKGDQPVQAITLPPSGTCVLKKINGFPVPDPGCTPGAVNPTLTDAVLKDKRFSTDCVRDKAKTEDEKKITYRWYKIEEPAEDKGPRQTCELDHLISLELGGADTLDNIWPQCGPSGVALDDRYFKQKDAVEDYLAWLVKNDRMDLEEAQKGIASDWTQYLEKAKEAACHDHKCNDNKLPPPRH